MVDELSRDIIDYFVISFFGVNDDVILEQIHEFTDEYDVDVAHAEFSDYAGFRKAVVKFERN